jgi:ubiquinone/menaquinone biosynthesis C-methylase UbiE
MNRDDYIAANRAAWDSSAIHHRGNPLWNELTAGFARPGYSCLDDVETTRLREIGVTGKHVAQLCCNNGRELISIRNLGAARCVGFDQSEAFLAQGRELNMIAGANCEFVCGDVYRISDVYDSAFDLVVITIGVFGWMPDLPGFFAVVERLLKPGGMLFVHEEHPVMNMMDPTSERPFEIANSYFGIQPEAGDAVIVYDGMIAAKVDTHYWFFHTLADIISCCVNSGLEIRKFEEYPFNINTVEYRIYERPSRNMPMSYSLVAQKPMT